MNERTVAGYYDEYVERQRAAGVNERHHLILTLALEHGLRDAHHVLEIGCGIGTLTGLVSKAVPNAHVLAVDLSPASIAAAREQFNDRHNITWKVADVVSDHLDNTYAMIILPDVLEHIPEEHHATLFRRLHALLAPGGRVLIHAPDPYYNDWVRTNHPEQLQVIDLSLHLPALVEHVHAAGLTLAHFQRHRIWMDAPDYMALTLVHAPRGHAFHAVKRPAPSLWSRMNHRLARLFR